MRAWTLLLAAALVPLAGCADEQEAAEPCPEPLVQDEAAPGECEVGNDRETTDTAEPAPQPGMD